AEQFWQGNENLAHLDMATANAILEEMAKFSKNVILDLNRPADEEGGAQFKHGEVTTPTGFKDAFKQFAEGGWVGLGASEEWGAPHSSLAPKPTQPPSANCLKASLKPVGVVTSPCLN